MDCWSSGIENGFWNRCLGSWSGRDEIILILILIFGKSLGAIAHMFCAFVLVSFASCSSRKGRAVSRLRRSCGKHSISGVVYFLLKKN